MENRIALEQQLKTARMVLGVLEQQAAGYTALSIPAHLCIELEEKRKEVQSLEERITQLSGQYSRVINNVPNRPAVFVGRQIEIARCLEALAPDDRGWGVVIDGIGGMGKTALALEVAQQVQQQAWFDAYLFISAKTTWLSPDGVREETLSHSSLDAFVREFARLLGEETMVRVTDATARRAALLDALRGRRVLLIWDNLETLTSEERGMIAEFLRKLPGANKALITSRQRTGESALNIRLDRLSFDEAQQLLVELGQRQPRVAHELAQSTPAVRLALYEAAGGNPLALHWTLGLVAQKGYTLTQALGRLQDAARSTDLYSFLFAIATHDLAASDRCVLAALATFQTPASTAALVDVSGLAYSQIEIALERLVTLSIVHDLEGAGYGLHPLTRTYVHAALSAESKSNEAKLDVSTHRKALRYWIDFAKQNGGRTDNYARYPALDAQWPNLEAMASALRALAGINDATGEGSILRDAEAARLLHELADALYQFLYFRGYWIEQIQLQTWAYAANLALGTWSAAGWSAYWVAFTYYNRGKTEQVDAWATRTAAAMARSGNRRDQAFATRLQGLVAQQRNQWNEASRFYQTALNTYRILGAEEDQAIVLNDMGNLACAQQGYEQAETYYRQALALAEKIGYIEGQTTYTGNLGRLALDYNLPVEARRWYERELILAKQMGYLEMIAHASYGLAQVSEEEGRYTDALAQAQEALQISERLGDRNLAETRDLVARLRQKIG